MKKSFSLKLVQLGLVSAVFFQVACEQNSDQNAPSELPTDSVISASQAFPGISTKLKQDPELPTNSVMWSTNTSVPIKRQIEVGDHPNVLLETYKMGQREQKVRFFVADDKKSIDLVSNSPQDLLLKKDVEVSKSENSKWSLFGMVIHAPASVGLQKFSDESLFNGLSITPQLMTCAADGLKNLKSAGDKTARVFQNWQIDTINIFVKPVQHAAEAESKMAIDPKLKALNFQLSMWVRSGDCFLPSAEEIFEALNIADQRIHD